tara:strand:- start:58 stop:435 length:378 start_codon:yes stop_codon:yes gene_type:complete
MSYSIEVNVDTINYSEVIDYYNSNKLDFEKPLGRLYRYEGGFEIDLDEKSLEKYSKDIKLNENAITRQLRWSNRCLVTNSLSNRFTEYQLNLLFDSIKNSIGRENVRKVDFINPSSFSYVTHIVV